MNSETLSKLVLFAVMLTAVCIAPAIADTKADQRTIILRERASASVLDGAFSFKLLRMKGYSVDVRVAGQKQTLKFGDAIAPAGANCTIVFHEISPETRIARFRTDCP